MAVIQKRRALIDEIDGRTVLVFVDQATFIPAAPLHGGVTRDHGRSRNPPRSGSVVRMGSLADARGDPLNVERPQQLFSRRYGFSLTFPRREIFVGSVGDAADRNSDALRLGHGRRYRGALTTELTREYVSGPSNSSRSKVRDTSWSIRCLTGFRHS
jgi:hypothetical protein